MGYTHYWKHGNIPANVWAKIANDATKLIVASDVDLAFDYDEPTKLPQANDANVRFNGVGDDGHETFLIHPASTSFEFCKTASKPYDKIVCAVLAVFKEHGGDIVEITSDGDEPDWQEGLDYAAKVLGRKVNLPVKKEVDASY
jgi:hypothetical protein